MKYQKKVENVCQFLSLYFDINWCLSFLYIFN